MACISEPVSSYLKFVLKCYDVDPSATLFGVIAKDGSQPSLNLLHAHSFPLGIVLYLQTKQNNKKQTNKSEKRKLRLISILCVTVQILLILRLHFSILEAIQNLLKIIFLIRFW